MKKAVLALAIVSYISIAGCDNEIIQPDHPLTFEFNFASSMQGWESFFSDYPVGAEESYALELEHSYLPEPLDRTAKALKISGNNHSDDLFSAIIRKFDGLKPNHSYAITFDVELASNAPSNAFGVGGSPDLALGAGGINYLPENSVDELNHYRPNFESQLQSG